MARQGEVFSMYSDRLAGGLPRLDLESGKPQLPELQQLQNRTSYRCHKYTVTQILSHLIQENVIFNPKGIQRCPLPGNATNSCK